jgi:hypothetical protein
MRFAVGEGKIPGGFSSEVFRFLPSLCNFRLLFAYTPGMFPGVSTKLHPFVIRCKGCRENIPAPI